MGVGIVISYWFDYGMSYVEGPVNWRLPVACQMIFAFVVIVLVFGFVSRVSGLGLSSGSYSGSYTRANEGRLPESPRWLYRHNRPAEALNVLCDLYDRAPTDALVTSEAEGILEAIRLETAGEYKWSQMFKSDEVKTGRRVLLAYGIQFMNQMGGINLVVVRLPPIVSMSVCILMCTVLRDYWYVSLF